MLYLAPWDTWDPPRGSRRRGFVPRSTQDGQQFTAIDLRIDPTVGDGWCFLWRSSPSSDPGLVLLAADKRDTIPQAVRDNLANRLGISLGGGDVAWRVVGDVCVNDRSRWKVVQPARSTGYVDVLIDSRLWYRERRGARPEPAMDPVDDFNRADEDPLGNGDWTTTDGVGLDIVSNEVQAGSAGDDNCSRWTSDTFPDDQAGECDIVAIVAADAVGIGIALRANSDPDYYAAIGNGNQCEVWRYLDGVFASLATGGSGVSVSDRLRGEAEGSTIRCLVNGTEDVSTTDTNITAGDAGVAAYTGGVVTENRLDNWRAGSLGSLPAIHPDRVRHHHKVGSRPR